jgi:hypothetical protein
MAGKTMLLLWPERWDDSMVWTMCLSMLVSMIHLWATIRGISLLVTNSLLRRQFQLKAQDCHSDSNLFLRVFSIAWSV